MNAYHLHCFTSILSNASKRKTRLFEHKYVRNLEGLLITVKGWWGLGVSSDADIQTFFWKNKIDFSKI